MTATLGAITKDPIRVTAIRKLATTEAYVFVDIVMVGDVDIDGDGDVDLAGGR